MIEDLLANYRVTQNEIIVAIYVFALAIIIAMILKQTKRNFPSGPIGLPIVGYLPFLTKEPHIKLMELSKKFGDIFSLKLGNKTIIVLNNADVVREAFLKPEILGRPPYGAFSLFKKQSPFFTSPLHVWQEQRRFVVQSMKDLGLGKSKIEDHIKDEIHTFLEVLLSHKGEPMDVQMPLAPSISNNISALVFGSRLPYDDPKRKLLDQNSEVITQFLGQTGFYQIFPWIRHVPFIDNSRFKKTAQAFESSQNFFRKLISEHKKTLDPQNIRDYVDSYLIQMESKKEKDPNTTFNENTLVDSATDLFGAGSDTAKTSILWCVYIMAAYPETQKQIQKEILEVIGPSRMAEFQDQKSMPFTHAVILEIMRWKTIVPLNMLHYTTADTTLGGYSIPRNTAVLANFWAIHHDPKCWSDPETFKPERFLSEDGKSVIKPSNYMIFSVGKRACPGETMAYLEIFLYFVSILQKFDIVFPTNAKPTFESVLSITFKPKPYMVRFLSKT